MKIIFLLLLFLISGLYSDASYAWMKNTTSYSTSENCNLHLQDYSTAPSYHGGYNSTLDYADNKCVDSLMYFKTTCDSNFKYIGDINDGGLINTFSSNGLYCTPYVPPPCEQNLRPVAPVNLIKNYFKPTSSNPLAECNQDSINYSSNGYTNLECWTDSCATDLGSEVTLYGIASISNPDADGDGIPDVTDLDDDNDGIPDVNDPDSSLYGGTDNSANCSGEDLANKTFYNTQFSVSEYSYYGLTNTGDTCEAISAVSAVYNGSFSVPDLSSHCENIYCYVHSSNQSCVFDVLQYKPSDLWINKLYKDETQCNALVDGVNYTSASFVYPDVTKCPNTSYCFVLPNGDIPTDRNTTKNPDLNSTSADLAPLLESQNNTNTHLENIEDKLDKSNDELKDINKNTSDLVSINTHIKETLDSMKLENLDKDLLSELKKNNDKTDISNSNLNDINKKLLTLTNTLSNDAKTNLGISSKIDTTNQVLNDIKYALINPASTDTNQTSSSGSGNCGYWHETFNTTTNECECDAGWSRNINGSCLINGSTASNDPSSLTSTNNILKDINSSLSGSDKTNLDLNETNSLLRDLNPFNHVETDTFSGMQTTVTDSFSSFYEDDIFALSSAGSSGLTTVSFTFYNQNIILFQPSMLDSFPMVDIRNLMLFFFALAGFITVFRTV